MEEPVLVCFCSQNLFKARLCAERKVHVFQISHLWTYTSYFEHKCVQTAGSTWIVHSVRQSCVEHLNSSCTKWSPSCWGSGIGGNKDCRLWCQWQRINLSFKKKTNKKTTVYCGLCLHIHRSKPFRTSWLKAKVPQNTESTGVTSSPSNPPFQLQLEELSAITRLVGWEVWNEMCFSTYKLTLFSQLVQISSKIVWIVYSVCTG